MNYRDYRHKTHPDYARRNWVFTIISFLLFGAVSWGLYSSWSQLTRDPYTIGFIVIPAIIIAVLLLTAVVHGRKHMIREIWAGILEILIWWR